MFRVQALGIPAPYRNSVEDQLRAVVGPAELVAVDAWVRDDAPSPGQLVRLAVCDSEERWSAICEASRLGPAVAVLVEQSVEGYRRAGRLEVGAVYYDTSTEIIVEVILAASRCEALVPLAVLGQLVAPANTVPTLRAEEIEILGLLDRGQRVEDVADTLGYSPRTVRRRIQGLHLKLNVADGQSLMERARSFGLL